MIQAEHASGNGPRQAPRDFLHLAEPEIEEPNGLASFCDIDVCTQHQSLFVEKKWPRTRFG